LHFTFPFFLIVIVALETISAGGFAGLRVAAVLFFLFLFVLLHELGHSVVARRYGIPILDITLMPIGGVARTLGLPRNPGEEIRIALAGPAVNYVLAIPLAISFAMMPPGVLREFIFTLLLANLMLGTFNLIPAFPMDGGRVLRATLALRKDYLDATRIAVWAGRAVAVIFVGVALYDRSWILLALIAFFIYRAGGAELNMARRLSALSCGTAGEYAAPLPPSIPGELSLARAWTWLETYPYAAYFVVELDATSLRLLGRLELSQQCLVLPADTEIGRLSGLADPPLPGSLSLAEARHRLMKVPGGMLPVRLVDGGLGILTLADLDSL
jgi:Zn-dependent protease